MSVKTKVTIHITDIKFFDVKINGVNTQRKLGRRTAVECRKYVRELCKGNIFIEKKTTTDSFDVDTETLYSLKV